MFTKQLLRTSRGLVALSGVNLAYDRLSGVNDRGTSAATMPYVSMRMFSSGAK